MTPKVGKRTPSVAHLAVQSPTQRHDIIVKAQRGLMVRVWGFRFRFYRTSSGVEALGI